MTDANPSVKPAPGRGGMLSARTESVRPASRGRARGKGVNRERSTVDHDGQSRVGGERQRTEQRSEAAPDVAARRHDEKRGGDRRGGFLLQRDRDRPSPEVGVDHAHVRGRDIGGRHAAERAEGGELTGRNGAHRRGLRRAFPRTAREHRNADAVVGLHLERSMAFVQAEERLQDVVLAQGGSGIQDEGDGRRIRVVRLVLEIRDAQAGRLGPGIGRDQRRAAEARLGSDDGIEARGGTVVRRGVGIAVGGHERLGGQVGRTGLVRRGIGAFGGEGEGRRRRSGRGFALHRHAAISQGTHFLAIRRPADPAPRGGRRSRLNENEHLELGPGRRGRREAHRRRGDEPGHRDVDHPAGVDAARDRGSEVVLGVSQLEARAELDDGGRVDVDAGGVVPVVDRDVRPAELVLVRPEEDLRAGRQGGIVGVVGKLLELKPREASDRVLPGIMIGSKRIDEGQRRAADETVVDDRRRRDALAVSEVGGRAPEGEK